jgi:IclR family pca regulon transcriptional regulator
MVKFIVTELKKIHISETLEKGLSILNLFNENHQGLKLSEITRLLGINKTSIYRYLNTYCKLGYLRKDPKTKIFKLGPRTVALAYTFIQSSDLVDTIKPIVDRAYLKLRVHIDVGLLHGDSIYALYRRENKDTIHFRHFTRGNGLHFLASGKAALAFLPEEEQISLIDRLQLERKTAKTITEKNVLFEELKKIRAKGYSLNNEEFLPGLIALGAPLINHHTSRVQGAISFDASTSRCSMEQFEKEYAVPLVALAKELSIVLPVS